jgi:hypothetical protein
MPSVHCMTKPRPFAKFGTHAKYVQKPTGGDVIVKPTQKL